ncbi:DedA family protein [Sulfurirhabdus autotrophica]|uniref:Membrane-associated protein n=1 Tax=Sulfurirhabdus autotrophica TaxID=1706046 RepID=A0A4R3Y6G7_9PROT|nr:DedA family protein [Sulfurirhabdus autotrophica]TCV85803.1 membrane-associated protein [Sulfurirhabdus autotrophica]
MEYISLFIDIVLHLDQHLSVIIQNYGSWVYLILFLIIFCETGLVITPFLPGDSLLFVAGTLAAAGGMEIQTLFPLLVAAAFLGDNTNYWIGRFIGPKVFSKQQSRFLNREYLEKTHAFYEKHGGKTIIFARFLPIIRTFAPFVAGIGRMHYAHFALFSFIGSIFWISFFVLIGYYFGNIPVVKQNLTLVMLGIIFVSILPGIIKYVQHRRLRT